MGDFNTIILCAGKINYVNLPIKSNTTNSMIPINGKPVIGWILDDLIEKQIMEVTVVLRTEDSHLQEFLQRVYLQRLKIQIAAIKDSPTILHSIRAGLNNHKNTKSIRIILGDTLIKDAFQDEDDFVYVHEVEDSERWCVAEIDNNRTVIRYRDKQEHLPKPHHALCGYYHLVNGQLVAECLDQVIKEGKREVSSLLTAYQNEKMLKAKQALEWFDFGNIDKLIEAKQKLLQTRYFNTLTVDSVLNTITKVSEVDDKIRNELNWYESLPDKLKVLGPRIISKSVVNGKMHLVSEYYGYPSLAELYLYGDLTFENWEGIFGKLLDIHKEFISFKTLMDEKNAEAIYATKTFERINLLAKQDDYWSQTLKQQHVVCNGEILKNIHQYDNLIQTRIKELVKTTKPTIIHGDFCFSNILFDVNNQIVRLIDPRGSFGKVGIYGDPRYDMAKLRHSISGLYDYIVSDLFEVEEKDYHFGYQVFTNQPPDELTELFDEKIQSLGYECEEVVFIEALLFLSMLPIHQDQPKRQKAMYLTGLKILNDLFK